MIKNFKSNGTVKTYSLYNGEVQLSFKEYGHKYEIDGIERVGVTTILKTVIAKEALINWAVKMTADHLIANFDHSKVYTPEELLELVTLSKKAHTAKKEASGNIGTRVHAKIETYIKGKINNLTVNILDLGLDEEDMREPLQAFLAWEQQNHVVWEASEQPVYSRKFDYCGTMDFRAVVNGKRVVGDLKTSNFIYPEQYYLQVAAYRYALVEEQPDLKIDGMLIIKVPKTKESTLELRNIEEYEANAKAFMHGLMLYRQVTKLKNFNK